MSQSPIYIIKIIRFPYSLSCLVMPYYLMTSYLLLCYYAENGLHEAVNGNNNNLNEATPGANTNENDENADSDAPGVPLLPPDSDPHTARAPDRPVPWSEMIAQTVHTFYNRGAPIPVVRTYVRCKEIVLFFILVPDCLVKCFALY